MPRPAVSPILSPMTSLRRSFQLVLRCHLTARRCRGGSSGLAPRRVHYVALHQSSSDYWSQPLQTCVTHKPQGMSWSASMFLPSWSTCTFSSRCCCLLIKQEKSTELLVPVLIGTQLAQAGSHGELGTTRGLLLGNYTCRLPGSIIRVRIDYTGRWWSTFVYFVRMHDVSINSPAASAHVKCHCAKNVSLFFPAQCGVSCTYLGWSNLFPPNLAMDTFAFPWFWKKEQKWPPFHVARAEHELE